MVVDKLCKQCFKPFSRPGTTAVYCGDACATEARRERVRKASAEWAAEYGVCRSTYESRKRTERRRAQGLCVDCGVRKATTKQGWRCASCQQVDTARQRKTTRLLMDEGRCLQCKMILQDTSAVYCSDCRELRSTLTKERYDKRVAEGLCVTCSGQRKAEYGYVMCWVCRIKDFERRGRLCL